jgi:hypothetical protein
MTDGIDVPWIHSPLVACVGEGERVILMALGVPWKSQPLLLEGTAAEIWRCVNGQRNSAEIAQVVTSTAQGCEPSTVAAVSAFLAATASLGLITRAA